LPTQRRFADATAICRRNGELPTQRRIADATAVVNNSQAAEFMRAPNSGIAGYARLTSPAD
jgi:hypothetical protein